MFLGKFKGPSLSSFLHFKAPGPFKCAYCLKPRRFDWYHSRLIPLFSGWTIPFFRQQEGLIQHKVKEGPIQKRVAALFGP